MKKNMIAMAGLLLAAAAAPPDLFAQAQGSRSDSAAGPKATTWSFEAAKDPAMAEASTKKMLALFKHAKELIAAKYPLPEVDFGYVHESGGGSYSCSNGRWEPWDEEEIPWTPAYAWVCIDRWDDPVNSVPVGARRAVTAGNRLWDVGNPGAWQHPIEWVLLHELAHIAKDHQGQERRSAMMAFEKWFTELHREAAVEYLSGKSTEGQRWMSNWSGSSLVAKTTWLRWQYLDGFDAKPKSGPYRSEAIALQKRHEEEADKIADEIMGAEGNASEAKAASGRLKKIARHGDIGLPGDQFHDGWLMLRLNTLVRESDAVYEQMRQQQLGRR